MIDAIDLPVVRERNTWVVGKRGDVYSQKSITLSRGVYKNIHQKLHRLLLDNPVGQIIDHVNQDKLDNRRSNLRIVSKSINGLNSDKSKGGLPYKGVYFCKQKNKYQALIKIDYKVKHIGFFKTAEEAAVAYRKFRDNYIDTIIKDSDE